jgi:hypothetical protein
MERDRDALLDSLAAAAPEALDSLTPEERYRWYKMLRLFGCFTYVLPSFSGFRHVCANFSCTEFGESGVVSRGFLDTRFLNICYVGLATVTRALSTGATRTK